MSMYVDAMKGMTPRSLNGRHDTPSPRGGLDDQTAAINNREQHALQDVEDQPFVVPDSLATVPLGLTLRDDLLLMAGVPAPPTQEDDLRECAAMLTKTRLGEALDAAEQRVPRTASGGGAAQEWEDSLAIALFTSEPPDICRVINGYLTEPYVTLRELMPVAPMVRRIYEAVQRLGKPYTGPAFRVIKACKEEGSAAMQLAYENPAANFAIGQSMDFCQFVKVTQATVGGISEDIKAVARKHKRRIIIMSYGTVHGYDINRFAAAPQEKELVCLPPAHFKICSPGVPVGKAVVVGIEGGSAEVTMRDDGTNLRFVSALADAAPTASSDPTIDRDGLLCEIEAAMQHNVEPCCVLHGPKGVGKSYLAHRFGEKWARDRRDVPHNVRWFSATSRDVLEADFRQFAQDCFGEVSISERRLEDLQQALKRLMTSTLNVLLIFDDVADEPGVEGIIRGLLPSMVSGQAPNMHVLITSSSPTLFDTGVWAACRREILPFTDEEVRKYLGQVLSQRPNDVEKMLSNVLFKQHVRGLPQRLQWVSEQLRMKRSMAFDKLLQEVEQRAARL